MLFSGGQTLGEVEFDVRGMVQLSAQARVPGDPAYPDRVEGIPVGQHGRRLHFLHAAIGIEEPGAVIGRYVVHTADGGRSELPIRYGQEVVDWIADPLPAPAPLVVAWTGASRMYPVLRLFRTTWENPAPEIEVTRIDFLSAPTRAAPFLVAITVEP